MTSRAHAAVDPITVEVIRNALNSAADEMGVNLARSSYSPIIYEMKDYSVALFNPRCELLGQAPGLPVFLGTLEDAIRITLAKYGAGYMRPGDVYIVNDPYESGTHLNDVTVFTPVFWEDRLIGFSASKTHWMDIGAMEPSQTMAATEIWQEGYRMGPTCIVRRGRVNRELVGLLELNSRLPKGAVGDFRAQIASCRTGEQRLQEIYSRHGAQKVEAAVEAIFAQCERLDREVVASIPDGVWRAEGRMDSDGHGTLPIPVKLEVRKAGSDIYVDLTGSAPQTSGCLNCGFAQTVSAAKLAFKFLVNPDLPASGGTFRCLHVTAEPGSVFAAQEPAACQYFYPHLGLMIDLFIRVMSEAVPDKVIAAQCADAMNVVMDGVRGWNDERWVSAEATGVGWGAGMTADGQSGVVSYGGGDLKNFPVEVIESRYPLRIHGYGLEPDSGGPGRHRGGLAIWRDYEILRETVHLSLWLERGLTGPWGLFGGHQGRVPTIDLRRPGRPDLHSLKCSHEEAPAGTTLHVVTGGGGGYGDPTARSRDLITADLADGYVTDRAARDLYGYESVAR
jgi:N-methylhydantoinase B